MSCGRRCVVGSNPGGRLQTAPPKITRTELKQHISSWVVTWFPSRARRARFDHSQKAEKDISRPQELYIPSVANFTSSTKLFKQDAKGDYRGIVGRLRGDCGETTRRPRGDYGETTGRPRGDYGEIAGRSRGDCREITGRLPGDYREIAGRLRGGRGEIAERHRGDYEETTGRRRRREGENRENAERKTLWKPRPEEEGSRRVPRVVCTRSGTAANEVPGPDRKAYWKHRLGSPLACSGSLANKGRSATTPERLINTASKGLQSIIRASVV